jgi:hypothetical protein
VVVVSDARKVAAYVPYSIELDFGPYDEARREARAQEAAFRDHVQWMLGDIGEQIRAELEHGPMFRPTRQDFDIIMEPERRRERNRARFAEMGRPAGEWRS